MKSSNSGVKVTSILKIFIIKSKSCLKSGEMVSGDTSNWRLAEWVE